jgi:hypothetical protein
MNLPSEKHKIQQAEIDENRPVSESLLQKIGSSINWILSNEPLAVGSVDSSELTLAQYQAINGTNFVLCDGSALDPNSALYAIKGWTNLPDFRGLQDRMSIDGTTGLGDYQDATTQSHSHHADTFAGPSANNFGDYPVSNDASASTYNEGCYANTPATFNFNVANEGSAHATTRSQLVNWFIRIN